MWGRIGKRDYWEDVKGEARIKGNGRGGGRDVVNGEVERNCFFFFLRGCV
jgi:hypothetical protein